MPNERPNESINIYLSAKDGVLGVFAARDGNRHEKAPAGPGRSVLVMREKWERETKSKQAGRVRYEKRNRSKTSFGYHLIS